METFSLSQLPPSGAGPVLILFFFFFDDHNYSMRKILLSYQVLQFYRLEKWCLEKLNSLYKAEIQTRHIVKKLIKDSPGGPVVNTSPSSAGHVGSIPGRGAKIPHALWPKKPKHKTEGML